jgi:hypothetical protein
MKESRSNESDEPRTDSPADDEHSAGRDVAAVPSAAQENSRATGNSEARDGPSSPNSDDAAHDLGFDSLAVGIAASAAPKEGGQDMNLELMVAVHEAATELVDRIDGATEAGKQVRAVAEGGSDGQAEKGTDGAAAEGPQKLVSQGELPGSASLGDLAAGVAEQLNN